MLGPFFGIASFFLFPESSSKTPQKKKKQTMGGVGGKIFFQRGFWAQKIFSPPQNFKKRGGEGFC